MLLDNNHIRAYRKVMKKMGLWDRNYSTIKQDLNSLLTEIRNRDFAIDIIGGAFIQMVMVARMITYGESEEGLSDDDIKTLLAPLEPAKDLFLTPCILNQGIESLIKDMLPLFFRNMNNSKDYHEFENMMRAEMAAPAALCTLALSYGIAMEVCLRKYDGMREHIGQFNKYLDQMLQGDENLAGVKKQIEGRIGEDESFLFSARLATAIVDCNLNENVKFEEMYALMDKIHQKAKGNPDMLDFLHSVGFKLFLQAIEEYHNIGKEQE